MQTLDVATGDWVWAMGSGFMGFLWQLTGASWWTYI